MASSDRRKKVMTQVLENPVEETANRLLAALDRGESLPTRWYTDPAITEREIETIFRKSWNYIGPANELMNFGDYITGYAGGVPVIVIRNETGLAGFVNVCRHRRHEVMKGRGNSKMMQCGYHAWTYDLTGCLKGAPRSAAERSFRLEEYPLLPIRAETLGPWVFVNLDWQAKPLASYFGELLDIIAGSGVHIDSLELYSREDWTAEANWKTMLENYLECYHCAVAHPGFSSAIDVKEENYNLQMHRWFASQLGEVRQSALEGKTAVKIYDPRGEVKQAQYHLLWPNVTINTNPGFPNLSIDVWVPDGPNKTKGFSEQYFGPGVSEKFAQDLIAFNKQVGYEDDVLTNSVQLGLLGGIPDKGRYLTNSESLCIHFLKLVVRAMTADTAGPESPLPVSTLPVFTTISVTPTASVAPERERNAYVELEVVKVEKESEIISSFYLRRADGKPLYPWEPGQFLPIRVQVPGHAEPLLRTYTLSTRSNPEFYRLSIRRGEGAPQVSQFLHDNAKAGFRLEAMMPRGRFVFDGGSSRPVVLVSGGVGITPMIAITEHIIEEGRRTGKYRPVHFVHGAQNSRVQAFGKYIRKLAVEHPAMSVHVRYSSPGTGDEIGVTHDSVGHVDINLLTQLLSASDRDFYLCGPSEFMNSLYHGLTEVGVPPERIYFESFGPGTVLKPDLIKHSAATDTDSVRVKFARSGIETTWSRDDGTLLELAEEVGLAPAFGCRSGICGTCKTRLLHGSVEYIEEPLAEREKGDILLCCSVPRKPPRANEDEQGAEVILDL
jgi:ferredoxin-NADP reductase/phenylpropionate dioxygenase-like ring-hydroxylating dioxygenase large terminal subunit